MAAESVGAAMRNDVSSMGYNIDNWPGMPLVGPANIEDMNARIDQAEQEMDNSNSFSWEQVMLDAKQGCVSMFFPLDKYNNSSCLYTYSTDIQKMQWYQAVGWPSVNK